MMLGDLTSAGAGGCWGTGGAVRAGGGVCVVLVFEEAAAARASASRASLIPVPRPRGLRHQSSRGISDLGNSGTEA